CARERYSNWDYW
nr:immunoglobulin heavy chain junction region [Mus musculus]